MKLLIINIFPGFFAIAQNDKRDEKWILRLKPQNDSMMNGRFLPSLAGQAIAQNDNFMILSDEVFFIN
jgi:hypothetical protein